jgi:hypothetical protein
MTPSTASIAACKNCGMLQGTGAGVVWLSSASTRGALEMLEEWPLCPNCETSQGATLVQYVRLALT